MAGWLRLRLWRGPAIGAGYTGLMHTTTPAPASAAPTPGSNATPSTIAFIGGGNMASALIGGLVRAGHPPGRILVIDPGQAQRSALQASFGVRTAASADALASSAAPADATPAGLGLAAADLVVWAVKPQLFAQAAAPCAAHVAGALQLSVMAGIRSSARARATGAGAIVRSMPNTPALIGRGIAGLFATPAVSAAQRALVAQVLAPTGQLLWVDAEADLDAVTALSGSGPAYVFYVIEAMVAAATAMGLSADQGRQLALATLDGATALAAASDEPIAVLRERVTSKGGTTYAALQSLAAAGVGPALVAAIRAAQARAAELGNEFAG